MTDTRADRYVVLGVAGSGKSRIGASFARAAGAAFLDADDLHPPANVAKMGAGTPLTDTDRAGWLRAVGQRLAEARRARVLLVVACSALKRSYRDLLRAHDPDVQFIELRGTRALIADRLAHRRGHFMPPALLDSQLATLEEPAPDEHAWVCDVVQSPEAIVDALLALRAAR